MLNPNTPKPSLPKQQLKISNVKLRAPNKNNIYTSIYEIAKNRLEEILTDIALNDRTKFPTATLVVDAKGGIIDNLKALGDGNHKLIEDIFLKSVTAYKSSKALNNSVPSTFLWEHLQVIGLCAIALDDDCLIALLHDKLDQGLMQELVNNLFISVLAFNATKVLKSLILRSIGLTIWYERTEKRIHLYDFCSFQDLYIKELTPEMSCRAFLNYLKFLEKHPGSADQIASIFCKIGLFSFEYVSKDNYCFIALDKFYEMDPEIQLLLLKIARDNYIFSFRFINTPTCDNLVDFANIITLSCHLSQLTESIGLKYRDVWRLIKCVSDLIPAISTTGVIHNFEDGPSITFSSKTRQKWGAKAIAEKNHLRCKGAERLIEFTAVTILAQKFDWVYPSDATPKIQIEFLDRLCGAMVREKATLESYMSIL